MATANNLGHRRNGPGAHTKPPRGVLLDIDGTLLDSNEQHARAWADALREDGVLVGTSDVRRLIGEGGDKILAQAGIAEESDRGRTILARRRALFRERYLPRCRPFSGARDLVARMREGGLVIDDVLHDREAEAQAPVAPRRRRVRLLEGVEDERQGVGPDPLPGIGHADADVRAIPVGPERDRPPFRGELHRVRQEIPDDLFAGAPV